MVEYHRMTFQTTSSREICLLLSKTFSGNLVRAVHPSRFEFKGKKKTLFIISGLKDLLMILKADDRIHCHDFTCNLSQSVQTLLKLSVKVYVCSRENPSNPMSWH